MKNKSKSFEEKTNVNSELIDELIGKVVNLLIDNGLNTEEALVLYMRMVATYPFMDESKYSIHEIIEYINDFNKETENVYNDTFNGLMNSFNKEMN